MFRKLFHMKGERMTQKKITFSTILRNLDGIITCVTLSICVILVNINVFTRYILKNPIPGCEEIVTSLFVWTVFIGSAYAHRSHSHLGVDILVNIMPEKVKKVVEIVVLVIELAVLMLVTSISAQYVYHLMFNNAGVWKPTLTDVLRMPKWWTAIAVPIGFGISTLYSIYEILADRLHIIKKKSAAGDLAGHTPEQGGGAV